jgi:hypothetical protein
MAGDPEAAAAKVALRASPPEFRTRLAPVSVVFTVSDTEKHLTPRTTLAPVSSEAPQSRRCGFGPSGAGHFHVAPPSAAGRTGDGDRRPVSADRVIEQAEAARAAADGPLGAAAVPRAELDRLEVMHLR